MGSGLVKCFVSRQIVPEGVPVVVFPIVQSSGYALVDLFSSRSGLEKKAQTPNNTTVYSNCFYRMQGVRFTCLADDYGRNCIEDTLDNKYSFILILKFLYQNSYETKEGDNSYHEKEFSIKKLLLKYKIILGKEKTNKDKIKYFDFFEIHNPSLLKSLNHKKMNSVYQELLSCGDKNRIFVRHYMGEQVLAFKFSICLRSVYDYAVNNESKVCGSGIHKEILENVNRILDPKDKIFKKDSVKFRIAESISRHSDGESADLDYHEVLYSVLDGYRDISLKDSEKICTKMKYIIDLLSFQRYLNFLEIPIVPISGYAQNYDNECGNEYLKMVKEVNSQLKVFIKKNMKNKHI